MLKVGVATKNADSWCSRKILEALRGRGVEAVPFTLREVAARLGFGPQVTVRGMDASEFDAVLVRPIGPGSLDEIIFRVDLLHKLERLGVPVVNPPFAIERAADKYFTLALMEEAGLAVPRTVVTESVGDATEAFPQMGGEVVLKPIFGSRGLGVTRTADGEVAGRVFRLLNYHHLVLYLQEFIPHGGRDIRAFVIGGRVEASMYRVSQGWKTNVSQGGTPIPFTPTPQIEDLAVRAAAAVGCEVAGVDIMESSRGPLVHEINSQPGFRGLQTSTGIDIAAKIAEYVVSKARRR